MNTKYLNKQTRLQNDPQMINMCTLNVQRWKIDYILKNPDLSFKTLNKNHSSTDLSLTINFKCHKFRCLRLFCIDQHLKKGIVKKFLYCITYFKCQNNNITKINIVKIKSDMCQRSKFLLNATQRWILVVKVFTQQQPEYKIWFF